MKGKIYFLIVIILSIILVQESLCQSQSQQIINQHYIINGAVTQVGEINKAKICRLSDVITPLPMACLSKISIIRNRETKIYNYLSYLQNGMESENPTLKDGDVIYVPYMKKYATFYRGEDYEQAYYIDLTNPMSFSDFIRNYSHLFPPNLDPKRCYLFRDNEQITIDLEKYLSGKITEDTDTLYLSHNDKILALIEEQRFIINGAVKNPQEFKTTKISRLSDIIRDAGGFHRFAALSSIKITRNHNEFIYNYIKYLKEGDETQNPFLMDGDFVYVPFMEKFATIYKIGDERSYWAYVDLANPLTFSQLLRDYPYLIPSGIDPDKCYLKRNGETRLIDLRRHLANEITEAETIHLENGDEIGFYIKPTFVYVAGSVNEPGQFYFIPGAKAQKYISMAGGVTSSGSKTKIYIIHSDGKREKYIIGKTTIKADDMIYIPEKNTIVFRDFLVPISSALSILFTIYYFANK